MMTHGSYIMGTYIKAFALIASIIFVAGLNLGHASRADAVARSVYAASAPSTCLIKGVNGDGWIKGTGFAYQPTSGGPVVVVTAKHVMEATGMTYSVTFPNSVSPGAKVFAVDHVVYPATSNDLAVLYLKGTVSIPGLSLAGQDPAIGDDIYVIGCPLDHANLVLSEGIVSQYDTAHTEINPHGEYVFGHTARADQGNSGGPILDAAGRVIGIVDCYDPGGSQGDNINYGIPVSTILSCLPHLLEEVKVVRAPAVKALAEPISSPAETFDLPTLIPALIPTLPIPKLQNPKSNSPFDFTLNIDIPKKKVTFGIILGW